MSLRRLPFREVRRKLLAAGFSEVSQKGSHVKYSKQHEAGTLIAIVPHHPEIAIGTLRNIVKQAGLTLEEFEEL
jgi:predicted RNA binding protein YcfA (HicA-like mRNA interferase family)